MLPTQATPTMKTSARRITIRNSILVEKNFLSLLVSRRQVHTTRRLPIIKPIIFIRRLFVLLERHMAGMDINRAAVDTDIGGLGIEHRQPRQRKSGLSNATMHNLGTKSLVETRLASGLVPLGLTMIPLIAYT